MHYQLATAALQSLDSPLWRIAWQATTLAYLRTATLAAGRLLQCWGRRQRADIRARSDLSHMHCKWVTLAPLSAIKEDLA